LTQSQMVFFELSLIDFTCFACKWNL